MITTIGRPCRCTRDESLARTLVNRRSLRPAIKAHCELDLWCSSLAKVGGARVIGPGACVLVSLRLITGRGVSSDVPLDAENSVEGVSLCACHRGLFDSRRLGRRCASCTGNLINTAAVNESIANEL